MLLAMLNKARQNRSPKFGLDSLTFAFVTGFEAVENLLPFYVFSGFEAENGLK